MEAGTAEGCKLTSQTTSRKQKECTGHSSKPTPSDTVSFGKTTPPKPRQTVSPTGDPGIWGDKLPQEESV